MLIPSVEVIWQSCFTKLSHPYCVTSIKTNESLMDRDIVERDGVQDFSDEVWLQKIFEGSSKKRTEYCKNGILLQAIQGHSGGIPIEPDSMEYVKIPTNWKKYINHRGLLWYFQSIVGKD